MQTQLYYEDVVAPSDGVLFRTAQLQTLPLHHRQQPLIPMHRQEELAELERRHISRPHQDDEQQPHGLVAEHVHTQIELPHDDENDENDRNENEWTPSSTMNPLMMTMRRT